MRSTRRKPARCVEGERSVFVQVYRDTYMVSTLCAGRYAIHWLKSRSAMTPACSKEKCRNAGCRAHHTHPPLASLVLHVGAIPRACKTRDLSDLRLDAVVHALVHALMHKHEAKSEKASTAAITSSVKYVFISTTKANTTPSLGAPLPLRPLPKTQH